MHKQSGSLGHSNSRQRVKDIFQEEEKLSKAFQITNFYTNQRLNIAELKQRLQQFKKAQKTGVQYQTPKKQSLIFNKINVDDLQNPSSKKNQTGKFMNNSQRNKDKNSQQQMGNKSLSVNQNTMYHPSKRLVTQQPNRQTTNVSQDKEYSIDRKQEARQANYRIVKQIRKSRYQLNRGSKIPQSVQPLNNLTLISRMKPKKNQSRVQKTQYSKCSNSSFNQTLQDLGFEGRIEIYSSQYLTELQKQMHSLWQLYQLLTKILLGLKEQARQQKNSIVKYIEDICSDKYQFIKQLLHKIQKENPSRLQSSFLKRIKKAIIQAKLYQNLSLLYVSLQICLKQKNDSNLVNFVGYCCSNVIFLLKFIQLSHQISDKLSYSAHTLNILAVISEFQSQSYKSQVKSMGDLILRIEHNNQVISKLQNKICCRMSKEFQQTIHSFLKNVDLDTKPLLQYAHYIYQFLAFHLAKNNVIGQFSYVQMAPSPYLNLQKKKTIVIEPWGVLFALRGQSTFIRSYSQTFITEVAKHCNIVYWTDLMPDHIDDLLEKVPVGSPLYRYHCRFENGNFLKLLWRIGCDVDNTIILDREEVNFKYDKQLGLQIPWKGKSKDSKLLELLNAILPLLTDVNLEIYKKSVSFRKSFPLVKQKLLQNKKIKQKKRSDVKSSYFNETRNQSLLPRRLFQK